MNRAEHRRSNIHMVQAHVILTQYQFNFLNISYSEYRDNTTPRFYVRRLNAKTQITRHNPTVFFHYFLCKTCWHTGFQKKNTITFKDTFICCSVFNIPHYWEQKVICCCWPAGRGQSIKRDVDWFNSYTNCVCILFSKRFQMDVYKYPVHQFIKDV